MVSSDTSLIWRVCIRSTVGVFIMEIVCFPVNEWSQAFCDPSQRGNRSGWAFSDAHFLTFTRGDADTRDGSGSVQRGRAENDTVQCPLPPANLSTSAAPTSLAWHWCNQLQYRMLSSTQRVGKIESERERKGRAPRCNCTFYHGIKMKGLNLSVAYVFEFFWGGLVLCQIGSMAVGSEAQK